MESNAFRMNDTCFDVQTFGKFSIRYGENILTDDGSNRKKVWMLIQYLLINHTVSVPHDKLIELLWSDESSDNPVGALKNLVYRARSEFKKLDEVMGPELIEYSANAYRWNKNASIKIDSEEFDSLGQQAALQDNTDKKLELYLEAIGLYKGTFLPKSYYSEWVVFQRTHYANLYSEYVLKVVKYYKQQKRIEELINLCEKAIMYNPFDESIHRYLIEGYSDAGRKDRALAHYNDISNLFYKEFGVCLSSETRKLYREMTEKYNRSKLNAYTVTNRFEDRHNRGDGAFFCSGSEALQNIYNSRIKSCLKANMGIYRVMLNMVTQNGNIPETKLLKSDMPVFIDFLINELRHGDVVCKYSPSQVVIMFETVSPENSKKIVKRLIKNYLLKNSVNGIDINATTYDTDLT